MRIFSTADTRFWPSGKFYPHGVVTMWAEGSMCYRKWVGPFNIELIQAMKSALAAMYAEFPPPNRYVIISEFCVNMLMPPDALVCFKQFIQDAVAAKRVPLGNAYVVTPEVEGGEMMYGMLREIISRHRPIERFTTTGEARAWAQALLDGGA